MKKSIPAAIFFGVLLIIAGCAKMQPQVAPEPVQGGEKVIALEASSYEFTPNNIKAAQGDTIVFNITNVSGRVHNFSIKDPHGKTLQDVDLPAKKTIPVKVTFSETGRYEFFCNKPFHPTFGMKGQVEVAAPR